MRMKRKEKVVVMQSANVFLPSDPIVQQAFFQIDAIYHHATPIFIQLLATNIVNDERFNHFDLRLLLNGYLSLVPNQSLAQHISTAVNSYECHEFTSAPNVRFYLSELARQCLLHPAKFVSMPTANLRNPIAPMYGRQSSQSMAPKVVAAVPTRNGPLIITRDGQARIAKRPTRILYKRK